MRGFSCLLMKSLGEDRGFRITLFVVLHAIAGTSCQLFGNAVHLRLVLRMLNGFVRRTCRALGGVCINLGYFVHNGHLA